MNKTLITSATLLASAMLSQGATVAGTSQDIQFSSINLETQVIELRNFGSSTIDLDGWRFCTHDETDGRDYTGANGLNGQSLAAGESLFIHWNDDASGDNALNISSLGGLWVDDLNADSEGQGVSINLYNSNLGGFGSSDAIADHIQYSYDGAIIGGPANSRGTVATGAQIWGSTADWISVNEDSTSIQLTGSPFTGTTNLQGSASFTVVPEPSSFLLCSLGGALALFRRKR